MSRTTAPALDLAGVEPLVPLSTAARLLGLAPKTLWNRMAIPTDRCPELRPIKIHGRWKVPVSVLRALTTGGGA